MEVLLASIRKEGRRPKFVYSGGAGDLPEPRPG